MTTQPNPYLGDPNMFLDLTSQRFNSHNGKIHDKIIDRDGSGLKLVYLGALLAKSKNELLEVDGIGPATLIEIYSFHVHLNTKTGREYKLRDNNSPRYEGTHHIRSHVKECEIIDAFDLPKDMQPLTEPVIHSSQTEQPKPMQGFCADDFYLVNTGFDITMPTKSVFYEIKTSEGFFNLIKDGYIDFETDNNSQLKEFKDRTFADRILINTNDERIKLWYDGQNGLKKLARRNVLESFVKAVEVIAPDAQKLAVEGVNERYGIKPKP